jgi:hypothetical protein
MGFAQEQRPVPVFPARAEAITADVVVLDKEGRPVRGLTREDFTLLEDGRRQTIVGFEARELTSPGKQTPREGAVTDERVAENKGSSELGGRTFVFLLDDRGTELLPMEEVKKTIATWSISSTPRVSRDSPFTAPTRRPRPGPGTSA